MWVKIKSGGRPIEFIQLKEMGRIRAACLPIPTMCKESEWAGIGEGGIVRKVSQEWHEDAIETIGIYFNAEDGTPVLLLEFETMEEAEESLSNLFLAWQRAREFMIYLVPIGTNWIVDPRLTKGG